MKFRVEQITDAHRTDIVNMVNFLPDPCFAIDLQRNIIAWNQAIVDLTGIKAQDMLGKGNYEYAVPFYGSRRPILIDLALNWSTEIANQYRYIKKEGDILVSEIENPRLQPTSTLLWKKACKLCDENGECIGAIEVIRNLTEWEKSEAELEKAVSEKTLILNTTSEHISFYDSDMRIQWINRAVANALGQDMSHLIGRHCYEVWHNRKEPCMDCPVLKAKLTGKPQQADITTPDNRVWLVRGYPVFDQDGNVTNLIEFTQDISERKRIEHEREITIEFLNLTAVKGKSVPEILSLAVEFLFRTSQCDAIGIRLKHNDDFPYFQKLGFSEEFVARENTLCARNAAGDLIRDPNGRPLLECLCGNVISGRFDPEKPYFTKKGSFWTNSTTELIASQDVKLDHMRYYCNTAGYESLALVPLHLGSERIGLIQFVSKQKGLFHIEDIQLWERLAETLTAALSKAQTEQALRDREMELNSLNKELENKVRLRTAALLNSNREIRELAHKTINAMENDRKVLAKELHDCIGGTLAAIMYQLESRVESTGPPPPSVEIPLERIITYIGNAILEVKRITRQLRPSVLDDFGLVVAIDANIREFETFHPKTKVRRQISINEGDLSSDAETVLYRVLQEALNNIGKHSKAANVDIQCRHDISGIILEIKDDGIGFEPGQLESANVMNGFGLHSMKERVEICNGKFRIESSPGKGTTIIAVIPSES